MSAPVVWNLNVAGPPRKVLGRRVVLWRCRGWRSFRAGACSRGRGRRCRRRFRRRRPFTSRHRRGWDVTSHWTRHPSTARTTPSIPPQVLAPRLPRRRAKATVSFMPALPYSNSSPKSPKHSKRSASQPATPISSHGYRRTPKKKPSRNAGARTG